MENSDEYILRFDGSSRGNPGKSGAGAVMFKNGEIIFSGFSSLGISTNNKAEYQGLILGLKMAISRNISKFKIEGDSKLIICQIKGEYKVKDENLAKLLEEVRSLMKDLEIVSIEHIPRELNKEANNLALYGSE